MTAVTWDTYGAIFLVVLPDIYMFSWPVVWFDTSYSVIIKIRNPTANIYTKNIDK